jgi:hypothetical protein
LTTFFALLLIAQTPALPTPQVAATPAYATVYLGGDPYGWGPWINAQRRALRLPPLTWSADLYRAAAANSALGFGHNLPAYRQNVGMGPLDQVSRMWAADPPHAAALFDPRINFYGLANVNGIWTFNGR